MTDLDVLRSGPRRGGEARALHAQQREVRRRVSPDEGRRDGGAVGQAHPDSFVPLEAVVRGEDGVVPEHDAARGGTAPALDPHHERRRLLDGLRQTARKIACDVGHVPSSAPETTPARRTAHQANDQENAWSNGQDAMAASVARFTRAERAGGS